MPTPEHYEAEQKFIRSGGKICPWCDYPVDEHATDFDQVKYVKTNCKLLSYEVAAWTRVAKPQNQQGS